MNYKEKPKKGEENKKDKTYSSLPKSREMYFTLTDTATNKVSLILQQLVSFKKLKISQGTQK